MPLFEQSLITTKRPILISTNRKQFDLFRLTKTFDYDSFSKLKHSEIYNRFKRIEHIRKSLLTTKDIASAFYITNLVQIHKFITLISSRQISLFILYSKCKSRKADNLFLIHEDRDTGLNYFHVSTMRDFSNAVSSEELNYNSYLSRVI